MLMILKININEKTKYHKNQICNMQAMCIKCNHLKSNRLDYANEKTIPLVLHFMAQAQEKIDVNYRELEVYEI